MFYFKTISIKRNKYDDKYENTMEVLGEGSFGQVLKMKSIQDSNK